jgi:glycosyltransferase involved in cell wall biosynthesis
MKVTGFTFLRNAEKFGYPFVASMRSLLPLVDEMVVALGPSDDGTEAALRGIGDSRIRILHTQWNEGMQSDYSVKGFIYGQQKSIALFNCTGDWAFYLEGDEVLHEQDWPKIRQAMQKHLANRAVEALAFDYLHFYGNKNTYAWSPRWYRTEARILRNTIPAWASGGLFFNVLESRYRMRYPRAAHAGATIYHYGWVRNEAQLNLGRRTVGKYWGSRPNTADYSEVDPLTLRPFQGTHPQAIQSWLPPAEGLFQANPNHRLTRRERKHRLMLRLERWLGVTFNKKHYRLVR